MKLIPSKDDPGSLYKRLISEDGKIEMGIYPVIFGFRVRAGRIESSGHSSWYDLDWCGGDDIKQIQLLYTICRTILEKRDSSSSLFSGLPPASRVKPFWKDEEFTDIITKAAGNLSPIISLTREELLEFKRDQMNHSFPIVNNPIKKEDIEKEEDETAWR